MWTIEHLFGQLVEARNASFLVAYVGPGLGAAALGVVLGLLTSVLLALFTVFWYPIKRCMAFLRSKGKSARDSRSQS